MRFESRELKTYAEPVLPSELKEGSIYFSVGFLDSVEMLIPVVEPLVFIGRNLNPGDKGLLYFQDAASQRMGLRYDAAVDAGGKLYEQPEDQIGFIFEFEHALDLLLACDLRRKKALSVP